VGRHLDAAVRGHAGWIGPQPNNTLRAATIV
jgi:hypothetical protein